MKIDKEDLRWVGETGIITLAQADQVWDALKTRRKDIPRMDIVHVAYYFGAFIIMSAMGWFMNDARNRFGGGVLAAIAVLYAAAFLIVGRRLWYGLGLKVPGGLSLLESDSEWNRFLYGLINLSFMLVAVLFQRNVFIVFGAIGVFSYIGHLAARVFADSLLFPLVLCLLGGLIMAAGI